MTDEQLHDELERRSGSVNPGRDWARRDLLPAVSAAIDSRPQRVSTSRGPALAGLAGVAAIILVLVVAIPRITPSPPVANNPSATAPGSTASNTSAPDPIRPEILSAQEFAVGVLTGRLLSSTVLVDGTIGARTSEGPTCVPPGTPCLMGRLEDTDPSVDVLTPWLATVEGQETQPMGDVNAVWEWWYRPSGPITGTLVLAVDGDGLIEFLGSVDATSGVGPLSVAEAAQVKVESIGLDSVVLVEGWLWSPEEPGRQILIDCVAPSSTPIPGLPNNYCQPRDSIISEQSPDGESITRSASHLAVQRGAARAYGAADEEPHVFAVAPRLYGACFEVSPCWQWNVVGRLTNTEQTTSEPSPPPVREIGCTLPPGTEPGTNDSLSVFGPSIIDEIGIVASCRVIEATPLEPFPNPISVQNPEQNKQVLEVAWSGSPCDAAVQFTLSRDSEGVHLDGTRPDIRYIGCDDSLVVHHLRVFLTEPLAAQSIAPTISDPVPSPGMRFECVGPPLPPGSSPPPGPIPAVIDETGLVESCLQTDFIEPLTGTISVSNPFEEDAIEVVWVDGLCDAAIVFTFRTALAEGYDLIGERPTECSSDGEPLPIYIRFTQPMPAEQIRASIPSVSTTPAPSVSPSPVPTPAPATTIDCAGAPSGLVSGAMTVTDHSGLIRGCSVPDAVDDDPAFIPTSDPNVLTFTWTIPCASDMSATVLEFWPQDSSEPRGSRRPFLLVADRITPDRPAGCFTAIGQRVVQLRFERPIIMDDVEVVLMNDGRGSDGVEVGSDSFALSLTSGAREYAAFEPIDVTGSVIYLGSGASVPVSGAGAFPRFTLQQVDGDIALDLGPTILPCPTFEDLRRDVPFVGEWHLPETWSARDPDAAFLEQYTQDGRLTLPPGTYRISASSRFNAGERCSGENVALATSIIIRVR